MEPLVLQDIHKSYGAVVALKGLSLTVPKGRIVGMIGPDGAGKTTAMRISCGLILPTSGGAWVMGKSAVTECSEIKQYIGYMPQRFSLYPDLTVEENLRFFADLYLVSRQEQMEKEKTLLHFSRLEPFRKRRAGALSGGMKQKLALSCTLIHTPDLLILDEPTTGVDPVSRQEFWQILRTLADDGMALLVSTPYMDEARLCDTVMLVNTGQIIAEGKPEEIPRLFKGRILDVESTNPTLLRAEIYRLFDGAVQTYRFGATLHIVFQTVEQYDTLINYLAQSGLTGKEIEPGIEDLFVSLTDVNRSGGTNE